MAEGLCLSVGSFSGMSQPRAALLQRRPFLPPAFPPSCLSSYPLRLASAPSKPPRSQPAAAAATPSGGPRGSRAEQRKAAGRRRRRAGAVCRPPVLRSLQGGERAHASTPPPVRGNGGRGRAPVVLASATFGSSEENIKSFEPLVPRGNAAISRPALAPRLNLGLLPNDAPAY